VLFVAGYLLVWASFGGIVYAVVHAAPLMLGGETAIRAGAAVLVLAGVYQFTPLKSACLRHCRSPLAFVAEHTTRLGRGGIAAARVGAVHGAFCLGCCWTLMLVLLVLGMMSLAWMAAVAAVIFAEKVLPRGWAVRRAAGFVLVGAGIVLMLSPRALPAFA
jgi:predicted metal-binding membrane protein